MTSHAQHLFLEYFHMGIIRRHRAFYWQFTATWDLDRMHFHYLTMNDDETYPVFSLSKLIGIVQAGAYASESIPLKVIF